MKVGQVEQTLEVSWVESGGGYGKYFRRQYLTAHRNSGDAERISGLQELLPMSAGVSLQGKPDVGDSNLAARSAIITYGVLSEPYLQVEGINVTSSHDLDTAVYFDSLSLGGNRIQDRRATTPMCRLRA